MDPHIYRCATITPLRPTTRPNHQQGGSSGSGHAPPQPPPPANEDRATTHTAGEHATITTDTTVTETTTDAHDPNPTDGSAAANTQRPTAPATTTAAAQDEEGDDTLLVQKGRGRRNGGGGRKGAPKRAGQRPAGAQPPSKRPRMGAKERQATTASTYIHAALSALRGQAGEGEGAATIEEGEGHLVAALQCLGRVTGEEEEEEGGEHENNSVGGTTPQQPPPLPPPTTREPGPGEEGYGSSSSRDGAGVAQPGRHGRLVEPITRATEAGRSTQGGQLQPQGGTTTWEEVARLAGQVCRGWGALTTEERMQDTMTILHLVRQGRRWLDAVKRTSNWELQSMAESKAAEAEQAALLALSYPNHHQAAGQIQHVQHHAEACVGAEAIALEVTLNTGGSEQASEGVHPADAISLAAGGEEAAPAGDRGWLQTGGHPAMRARSILRHLLPFTGGEVRQQVQAALGALDEWSTELWGGELLAIEDTLGNSGEEMHPPPPPPTHHAEGTGRGTDGGGGKGARGRTSRAAATRRRTT